MVIINWLQMQIQTLWYEFVCYCLFVCLLYYLIKIYVHHNFSLLWFYEGIIIYTGKLQSGLHSVLDAEFRDVIIRHIGLGYDGLAFSLLFIMIGSSFGTELLQIHGITFWKRSLNVVL